VKPALSIIFFTVASGAGFGLAVWTLVQQLAGRTDAGQRGFWIAVGLAAVLVTAGLLSSTLHLANPRNAWRAVARFRSSWLSREGVLALVFYPLAALHLWASLGASAVAPLTATLLALLAIATVVSTAMIYACLKTVPRWRTWHTPVVYLLYALAAGGLLWTAIAAATGGEPPRTGPVLGLVLAAALVKLAYYAKFSRRVHATLNEALAVPETAAAGRVQGRVRLLDAGHTHGTFLTQEFGFVLARGRAGTLRVAMFVLTLAPLALLGAWGAQGAWPAAVAFLAGVLLERWLFFAQAEHVVRLYHGQQSV
jgi:sulfite dehydrogenase (quinone) subunit SoeC